MEREDKERLPNFLKPRVLEQVTPMYSQQAKKVPETPILSGASLNHAKEWEDINFSRLPERRVISEEAKRIIEFVVNKRETTKICSLDVFQDGRTKYIYKLSQDYRVAQVTVRSKLSNDNIKQKPVLSFETLEKVIDLMKKKKKQPEVAKKDFFETSTQKVKMLPDFLAKIVEKSKAGPIIESRNSEEKKEGEYRIEETTLEKLAIVDEGGLFGYRNELPLLSRVKQEVTFDYDKDSSQNEDEEEEEEDDVIKGKKKSKITTN